MTAEQSAQNGRHAAAGAGAFSVALALLLAIIFFDPLFSARSFTGRDLVAYFYPIEKSVHDQWRSGHVPLILPELSFGKPLAANPNAGVFYPLRIAMAAVAFPLAIKLFIVLHFWLAAVGAFLLARFLGASRSGAAIAALTFGLCGPVLSEASFPDFLPGVAAMPFLVLAAGRFARRPGRRGAALFGAAWGWMLLVGDVFTAGVALFGAVLAVVQESPRERRARAVGGFALASLPGFLIAGIQAVPALLFVPQTVRALGKFPLRAALTWSVSLWRFAELLVRFPFGNAAKGLPIWGDALWSGKTAGFAVTLYLGVLGALALCAARPARGKRLLPFALAGACAAAAVAGFYVPDAWLDGPSPIPLRYPEKLMVGFALAAAILAATLADRIRAGERPRLWRGALAIAAALALSSALARLLPGAVRFVALSSWTRSAVSGDAAAGRLPGILLRAALPWAAAAVVLLFAARSRPSVVAALLVGFAAADLVPLRFSFVRTGPDSEVLASPPAAEAVRRITAGGFGYLPLEDYYSRGFDREALLLDSAALDGIVDVFNEDYDTADLYRVELARREIYREAGRWEGLPRFLSAFGARTTLVERGRMPAGFSLPAGDFGRRWLLVNPAAVPLLRFAPAVEEVPGPAEAWRAVHEGRDLVASPVVETGGAGTRELSSGTIRLLSSTPGRLDVETQTAGPARLILPRAYFPFRETTLDGRTVSAEPANLVLTSIAVPAGDHRISLEERLPGGTAGPLLSAAGIALVLLLALGPRTRRRESV